MSTAGKPNNAGREGGFTLVELAVVLAVLAAVVGLVAPLLPRFLYQDPLNESAGAFASVVRHARNQALIGSSLWEVVIDREQGRFTARPATRPEKSGLFLDESVAGHDPAPSKNRQLTKSLSEDVVIESVTVVHGGEDRLTPFFRIQERGLAEEAWVRLSDRDDNRVTLAVVPFSGQVRILDGHVERDDWIVSR